MIAFYLMTFAGPELSRFKINWGLGIYLLLCLSVTMRRMKLNFLCEIIRYIKTEMFPKQMMIFVFQLILELVLIFILQSAEIASMHFLLT